ncbi:hypothetical protein [Celeribacter neptunius]|uniref:Uncharacterized protein n=1 Tax=Celeribacter neptunius TaxID=588602 RepID=A0A1I3QMR2_9RHOB|nr:hypothetical protein [Celeribacter neptunius]SFJ34407.1 hypothetical protein SAMN04487991_1868 [Celeribacter neptunius]
MKLLSLAAFLGSLGSLIATPVLAQQNCGSRDQVLNRLESKYGESRQSIGLAPNSGVVEVFASPETGTWTILMTQPDGTTCLIASGQAFEAMAAIGVTKGDDV